VTGQVEDRGTHQAHAEQLAGRWYLATVEHDQQVRRGRERLGVGAVPAPTGQFLREGPFEVAEIGEGGPHRPGTVGLAQL